MLIHCTKRACERLKIKPPAVVAEYDPLYSWRLNVIEEGRRRLVVFMNDASRYCVSLTGIKAKDWPKLPQLFMVGLRNVMLAEQINPDIIDRYISEAGKIEYFRNNDNQMTAWLNKACDAACLGYGNHDGDVDISLFVCHYHVGTKDEKNHWEPSERFHTRLSQYGLPLKRCHAFELDVSLQIHSGLVCRTIIVPANITFEQLAEVIKRAYGWWNYENQYHFLLCKDNGVPELYLRKEKDPSIIDFPTVARTKTRLSEYLPKYKAFRFHYDYRADWTLLINVAAEYDSYIGEVPHLKSGSGNAPSEYVGGTDGHAKFLDKLTNGKYLERQEAARWGKYYGYKEFDLEKTQGFVERSLI